MGWAWLVNFLPLFLSFFFFSLLPPIFFLICLFSHIPYPTEEDFCMDRKFLDFNFHHHWYLCPNRIIIISDFFHRFYSFFLKSFIWINIWAKFETIINLKTTCHFMMEITVQSSKNKQFCLNFRIPLWASSTEAECIKRQFLWIVFQEFLISNLRSDWKLDLIYSIFSWEM